MANLSDFKLVAEQLSHALDLLRAENAAVKAGQAHDREALSQRLSVLEAQAADFESRLRALTEAATQHKLLASLATGGGLISLITLLKWLLDS